jgi:hypothetical protein
MEQTINNILLMVNGPIRKFVRQQCNCDDSSCIDYSEFIGNSTIRTTYNVCSVCQAPYHVEYDTSNITMLTNIGEEDAKREEKIDS